MSQPTSPAPPPIPGFDAEMGFRLLHATGDEVVIEYEIAARHLQPYGIVHGGVHCAIVESACSTGAAFAAMKDRRHVVGLENHTSFIRAARKGKVRATARPLTRGRRSQVWEARVEDGEGRLLATGRVRLLCLDEGSDLAGRTVGAGR
ncbi:PaaI family thioesterase [bacterium]|nr:PaaI family thioesterase [bacterium]